MRDGPPVPHAFLRPGDKEDGVLTVRSGPRGGRLPKPVDVVVRALGILQVIHQADKRMTLTDLSRQTGLPRPTVYRLLHTLIDSEFVEYDPDTRTYTLGPRLIEFGLRHLAKLDIRKLALPLMRRLRDLTQETVALSVVVGHERQYVEQLESPQEVRQTIELGRRVPLHAGGSGKAILAFFSEGRLEKYLTTVPIVALTPHTILDQNKLREELRRIRELGYAWSVQERQTGAATVAAPVFAANGLVKGCLSVSGPYQRFPAEKIKEYGPLVKSVAHELSRQMGWYPSPVTRP